MVIENDQHQINGDHLNSVDLLKSYNQSGVNSTAQFSSITCTISQQQPITHTRSKYKDSRWKQETSYHLRPRYTLLGIRHCLLLFFMLLMGMGLALTLYVPDDMIYKPHPDKKGFKGVSFHPRLSILCYISAGVSGTYALFAYIVRCCKRCRKRKTTYIFGQDRIPESG